MRFEWLTRTKLSKYFYRENWIVSKQLIVWLWFIYRRRCLLMHSKNARSWMWMCWKGIRYSDRWTVNTILSHHILYKLNESRLLQWNVRCILQTEHVLKMSLQTGNIPFNWHYRTFERLLDNNNDCWLFRIFSLYCFSDIISYRGFHINEFS